MCQLDIWIAATRKSIQSFGNQLIDSKVTFLRAAGVSVGWPGRPRH